MLFRSMLKLSYIDLNDYLATLKADRDKLKQQLSDIETALQESPNSKKNKNKHTQVTQQVASNQRKIKETETQMDKEGHILNLAAALYIYNDHEMYYLSSGSNPKYNAYMGAYRLQWEMIKFAKEHHLDRYNFYGVTGEIGRASCRERV